MRRLGHIFSGLRFSFGYASASRPNPNGVQAASSVGFLQVLSRQRTRSDDQNQAGDGEPVWHQHTNYRIYDLHGHLVKRVSNAAGHYAESAEVVPLQPGKYVVKAPAKDYPWIQVMVAIEPGRTTGSISMTNGHPPPLQERSSPCQTGIPPAGITELDYTVS